MDDAEDREDGLGPSVLCGQDDDAIPLVETYRGVGIEDQQPPERIELVKREIDRVHRMSAIVELADYAGDAVHPPEARMLGRRPRGGSVGACRRRAASEAKPGAIARRDGRAWLPALARPRPLCVIARRAWRC